MAEYIKREAALHAVRHAWGKGLEPAQYIEIIPTADVAPVVRCRGCKYSYEDIDGLTCIYGPLVDCTVPEDFYCKYGEREEE